MRALGFVVAAALFFTGCSFLVKQRVNDLMPASGPHSEVAHFLVLASEFWTRYAFSLVLLLVFVAIAVAGASARWKEWRDDRAWAQAHAVAGSIGGPTAGVAARVYRLRVTPTTALLSYGLPAMFVVITILLVVIRPEGMTKSSWSLALWFAAVVSIAWQTLRMPVEISLAETGELTFSGIIGRRVVPVASVRSVKPGGNREGMLILKHAGGRIYFSSQFDLFHDFLRELKRMNPAVELEGC
jgi:hypothetical protein